MSALVSNYYPPIMASDTLWTTNLAQPLHQEVQSHPEKKGGFKLVQDKMASAKMAATVENIPSSARKKNPSS